MLYGGNTSCIQINSPAVPELIILDAGTGIRNLGNELCVTSCAHRGNIFITHPHWDHVQGFPFFKPFFEKRNSFAVFMPEQLEGGCEEIMTRYLAETFFPVRLDMMEADITCYTHEPKKKEFDSYSVDFMFANHTILTGIYKLEIEGKTIVYAPDNELPTKSSVQCKEFLNRFMEFVNNADVLIHDAQYTLEDYKNKIGWGHSAHEVVLQTAAEAGVKHLFLMHHDPDADDDTIQNIHRKLIPAWNSQFASCTFAIEGTEFKLS